MRPTGWTEMSIWELDSDKRIVSCQERCTIGRNDRERETEDWRESAERGPEVSWNEREAAARSRYVSSAGSPANRSTVGAAGRRRQFRADRRCNHPRPCPPLLSGPSGGLFSLPPCRAAPQQSPRLFLRAHRPSRQAFSLSVCVCVCVCVCVWDGGGNVTERRVTGRIRQVANSATERVPIGCDRLRSDRYQPRDKQACRLFQLPPLRPPACSATRRVWRLVTRAFEIRPNAHRIFAWSVICPTIS